MYFEFSLAVLIVLFVINAGLSTIMRLRLKKKFEGKYESLITAGKLAGPFARKGVSSYLLSSNIGELNDSVLHKQGVVLRWVTLLYAISFFAVIVSFALEAIAYNS